MYSLFSPLGGIFLANSLWRGFLNPLWIYGKLVYFLVFVDYLAGLSKLCMSWIFLSSFSYHPFMFADVFLHIQSIFWSTIILHALSDVLIPCDQITCAKILIKFPVLFASKTMASKSQSSVSYYWANWWNIFGRVLLPGDIQSLCHQWFSQEILLVFMRLFHILELIPRLLKRTFS